MHHGHLGEYDGLDEEKLAQIHDIILCMYRPNDGKALCSKCREAIGKKYPSIRSKASTNCSLITWYFVAKTLAMELYFVLCSIKILLC